MFESLSPIEIALIKKTSGNGGGTSGGGGTGGGGGGLTYYHRYATVEFSSETFESSAEGRIVS